MTEQVEGQEGQQQVELTPVEKKALEMGWRPKEEYDGPEEDFVDAKEFVGRQPLFERLSKQGRHIKQLEQSMEALKTHYTTVRETEYKRAIEALKAERKTALQEGDGDKFEKLSEEIDTLTSQTESMKQLREQPVVQETQVHPTFQHWVAQNPWYQEQAYMRQFADDEGTRLYKQGLPPEEVLKKVSEAVKKEFPHKFRNPNKDLAPNTAESGGKPAKTGNSMAAIEGGLTDQERSIMNTLLRQKKSDGTPLMTKEQYLKELQASKG